MRRALVTGATGMLGSYLVRRLCADGVQVRALVRDAAGAGWLEAAGAEIVPGELLDAASLLRAARGCEVVFHAAALVGTGRDPDAFRSVNVGGTARVVAAATAARARLIHVSSTAVFGQARWGERPTDERHPLPRLPRDDLYGRSKQAAERVVAAAQREGRLRATVVRPPVMYGRRDRQLAPRLGPVLERGYVPLPGGGDTTLTLVHAASVAEGAVRAAVCERAVGRVYHLTDDAPLTLADLVRWAGRGLGRSIRTLAVPTWLGWAAVGPFVGGLALAGRGDLARHVVGALRMVTRDNPFTSARARDEIGWTPDLDPATGVADAFRWWAEHRSPCLSTSVPLRRGVGDGRVRP